MSLHHQTHWDCNFLWAMQINKNKKNESSERRKTFPRVGTVPKQWLQEVIILSKGKLGSEKDIPIHTE